MSFHQAFFDELEKQAVRIGKTSFRQATDKDLVRGAIRQKPVRAALGLTNKSERRKAVRALHAQWKGTVEGTITPNKRGGSDVLFRKGFFKRGPRADIGRRGVLAHEAFHANVPVLGQSEIAAHAYGGWKDKKSATFGKRLGQAAQQVGHAFKTRPFRAATEAAVASGLAYGGYRAAKAIKNRFFKKKKDRGD